MATRFAHGKLVKSGRSLGIPRAFVWITLGGFAACGLSSREGKDRCDSDADCLQPNRCFAGKCRLKPPECEGNDCAGSPNGGDGGTGAGGDDGETGGAGEDLGGTSGGGQAGDAGGASGERGIGGAPRGGSSGAESGGSSGTTSGASGAGGDDACMPVTWQHLEDMPPLHREVPATTLSRGLATVGVSTDCLAILFTSHAVLTSECSTVRVFDEVCFDAELSAGVVKPTKRYPVLSIWEAIDRQVIAPIASISRRERPTVPWSPRSPLAGETLTAITYGIDGLARGLRLAIEAEVFAGSARAGKNRGPQSAIFGSDGKFLGYCRVDSCGEANSCVSMSSIFDRSDDIPYFFGSAGIRWGTVNGDRTMDAVAVHFGNIFVGTSSATGLTSSALWLGASTHGSLRTFVGDLDGDALSDLVIVDRKINVATGAIEPAGIRARRSTGSAFESTATIWSSESFDEHPDVLLANVDGQVGDEMVAIHDEKILVWQSTGSVLAGPAIWATPPAEFERAWLSEVTGDGLADAVFAVDDTLVVYRSSGTAFGDPETWLENADPGAPGWFFADVTGDGASDALAIDTKGVRLFPSNRERFVLAAPLSVEPALGERANSVVDVNGDGKADVIAENHLNLVAYLSTGSDFEQGVPWYNAPFYGAVYANE